MSFLVRPNCPFWTGGAEICCRGADVTLAMSRRRVGAGANGVGIRVLFEVCLAADLVMGLENEVQCRGIRVRLRLY